MKVSRMSGNGMSGQMGRFDLSCRNRERRSSSSDPFFLLGLTLDSGLGVSQMTLPEGEAGPWVCRPELGRALGEHMVYLIRLQDLQEV